MESDDATKHDIFFFKLKAETTIPESDTDDIFLDQLMLQLCQTYKNHLE